MTVKSTPDIYHLPEPSKKKPSYLAIKNGELIELHSTKDLLDLIGKLKKKDEILVRDNIGEFCAAICIKFDGTDECLMGDFFADLVKKKYPTLKHISFGLDRTKDDFDTDTCMTDWGKVTYNNNVTAFDKWFDELWNKAFPDIWGI